ncbi:hypothetical protein EB796_008181 [Bugula neritina]|uniref:Fibronectin type-III domain-containing protein n=1 Tax=Bugula neritina TaxID=10212 RepID=A0A7J7K4F4_BUGNE|nr:hypothetical protein EB796_008181 [Bugula neritina]
MWIRIDLVNNYFVTEVNVFTVNYKNYWNSVYYEESGLAEWNVDIRPASYSLYVAVVRESSGGLTLSEVEVFGYAPAEFKPKNLTLSQTSSDCVRLDWDNPYTDVEANYQYSCGTSSWKSSGSNTYGTVCGLTPAVGLQCSVRVDDVIQTEVHKNLQCSDLLVTQPDDLTFSTGSKTQNGGRWRYQYSVSWKVKNMLLKSMIHTLVYKPQQLSFGEPIQVTHSNRKRWKYTITWQEPETYGCIHPTYPYQLQVDGNLVVEYYKETSDILYKDGGESLTIKVWLRNKHGVLSKVVTKTITTSIINLRKIESFSSCASISHYDLTIKLNKQQIFYKRYSAEEIREKVLEELDPYTNYTIILIAVNNAFYQSSAEPRYITTPELAPYDGPSLSVDFDTNCAHLTIQDPAQPNGIITEYQYTCYYANTEEGIYQMIQSDKVEVKLTETIQRSFIITVHQVTLDNKSPDSYVFVVQKETSTSKRKKRSPVQLPPECDLDPDCYITAEIDSSLVDSDGYDFRVGDGKTYQDYYNAPLEPNQDYKIYQAVTVKTEKGDNLEDIGLSSIQGASTDVPEYAEVSVDKNPAPTYESMNTVTEDHNYEKVVHTVHNLSPNTTLYQNMQD